MKKQMFDELSKLPEIPPESTQAYREHLNHLVDQVNKKMVSREDIASLIRDNDLDAMFENHRNHAVFMENVFFLNAFSMLRDIVPWVYRTYSNHGFSFDYFPAHVQAWKEALQENLDFQTIAPILRVYDWILGHHADFVELSRKDVFSNMVSSMPRGERQDRFLNALLRGDRQTALEMSREEAVGPSELERFYEETMKPSMYRIGEMWERGDITVSEEHLASALGNMIVSSQYIQVMQDLEPHKGRVLVTVSANEYHVLGAQILANSLEANGWEVDFLGANTPPSDLVRYIEEKTPDIVAISATMPFNLLHVQEIVDRIRNVCQAERPWIMLGGLAFVSQHDLAVYMGGDGYAANSREAVTLAEKWRG
jgi:methanogenic corrinoid protein MtbC1